MDEQKHHAIYWLDAHQNMGVTLYKRLPLKIKKLDNFNQFSIEVKLKLLNNSLYTLEEFLKAKVV